MHNNAVQEFFCFFGKFSADAGISLKIALRRLVKTDAGRDREVQTVDIVRVLDPDRTPDL